MHQLASKLLSMRSTGLQDTLWQFLRDILCIIFHSCPFLQMSVFQSSANLNAERSFFLWEPNFTGQVLVSRQTQRVMMRERERETERNGENSQVRTTNTWSSFTSERALGQRMPLPRNWMIHMPGRKVVGDPGGPRSVWNMSADVRGLHSWFILIHLDSTDGTAQVLDLDLVNLVVVLGILCIENRTKSRAAGNWGRSVPSSSLWHTNLDAAFLNARAPCFDGRWSSVLWRLQWQGKKLRTNGQLLQVMRSHHLGVQLSIGACTGAFHCNTHSHKHTKHAYVYLFGLQDWPQLHGLVCCFPDCVSWIEAHKEISPFHTLPGHTWTFRDRLCSPSRVCRQTFPFWGVAHCFWWAAYLWAKPWWTSWLWWKSSSWPGPLSGWWFCHLDLYILMYITHIHTYIHTYIDT